MDKVLYDRFFILSNPKPCEILVCRPLDSGSVNNIPTVHSTACAYPDRRYQHTSAFSINADYVLEYPNLRYLKIF